MPRPSVATERRAEIIEATLRTLSEHGARNTSLDKIADTVGRSRGYVRHFVGNRDELLADAARFVFTDELGTLTVLPTFLTTFTEAVEFLFSPEYTAHDQENAVVLALVELSRTNDEIASILAEAYANARRKLVDLLAVDHPKSDPEQRETVATGTLTIALGNVFLGDFDQDDARTATARAAAAALASSLD